MSFEWNTFVYRHFYLVILSSLALCAFYSARGINCIIAAQLSSQMDSVSWNRSHAFVKREDLPRPSKRNAKSSAGDKAILSRNIFSSVIGPIEPSKPTELRGAATASEPIPTGEMPVVPCEDAVPKVLATVVSDRRPEWSFASIATHGEKALYRQGDELGDKEVFGISWRYVFLRGSSSICYIDLFGENNLKAVALKRGRVRQSKIPRRFRKDVAFIGPNTREISRTLANRLSRNPTRTARQLRLRPYKKQGEIVGFRVRRLSASSPFRALGLKRGDVIRSVNGTPLNSVDGAMAAYAALKDKNEYSFLISRRGKPITLKVKVK
ncbi:MAG: PDZ domain-containing protein [Deltaproteobacteria bacterium]|nr:PDZ domain-containing protein [Deltaproteobacteria bacterium]MBN2674643.1 PDZ domain-containing protein [Deltaproteobacteria bacterium]